MKHVWYIDEDKYTFNEGYVNDNYKKYYDNYLWEYCEDENHVHNLGIFKTENIFDNKETALNIYKGMIQIQRDKNSKEIERLQKENEILFKKLLNI